VTSEGEGVSFSDVLFEFDSSTLRPSALSILEPVLAALRQRPEAGLLIEGHTCNVGTSEYNLALGERRAAEVRNYLVRQGYRGQPADDDQLWRRTAVTRQQRGSGAAPEPARVVRAAGHRPPQQQVTGGSW
jgi:hypothetical protein